MRSKNFKMASLFSGAGGMDVGFSETNKFKMLLANDILSAPAQTYVENFPHKIAAVADAEFNSNKPVYLVGDISKLDFSKFDHSNMDCVVGGPPCQDFSIIRGTKVERQGLGVKRGRLYSYFISALIHFKPKVFAFENVPGLTSANKGVAYRTIVDDLSNLNARWSEVRQIVGDKSTNKVQNYSIIFSDIIDSANLGAPQRRKRLIIMGIREDLIDSVIENELRLEVESILLGRKSLLKKYPLTSIEAFTGLPLTELNDEYREIMKDYDHLAEKVGTAMALKWKEKVWKRLTFDAVDDYLSANKIIHRVGDEEEIKKAFDEHGTVLKELGYYKKRIDDKEFADDSNKVSDESKNVSERMKMIPPDENHLFVKGTKWNVEGRGMSLVYRRMHPLKPSYTVVAYGGGGTWGYHYKSGRGKLTNRERARLQTFPDWFMFKGNTSQVRAQIGEAVPSILGKKIAQAAEIILNRIKS